MTTTVTTHERVLDEVVHQFAEAIRCRLVEPESGTEVPRHLL